MRRLCQTVLLFVFLALLTKPIAAQAQICEASKLKNNKTTVRITFDHLESKQNSNVKTVWLRLHNDTKCKLIVPMSQSRAQRRVVKDKDGNLIKNAKGGVEFESTYSILNGSKEMVIYDLFNNQRNEARIGNIDGDNIVAAVLDSEYQLLFPVDLPVIRKDWALYLKLSFEGKNSFDDVFRIFYQFNDLPSNVPRNKSGLRYK